jgi:hypothetical protein
MGEVPVWTLALGLSGVLPPMLSFRKFLDQLLMESGNVVRFATGNQPLIGDDLLIGPLASCVPNIRFSARARR